MNKLKARNRRGLKTRAIIRQTKRPRLTVFRSNSHLYSQIIVRGETGDMVLASASTTEKELKGSLKGNKCEQAAQVGALIAKRAIELNVTEIAFDRSGYKYHGRIKALADSAREAGLNF
jgi:large subunit ribosomal protein L18